MAITHIGTVYAESNTVTPTTHAIGDLMVAVTFAYESTTLPTVPAGWTSVHSANDTSARLVAYKVATATNDESGTWTNAEDISVSIYRGASGIGAVASSVSAIPPLTLTAAGRCWVMCWHNSATPVLPSGFTSRFSNSWLRISDTNAVVSSYAGQAATSNAGIVVELIEKDITAPTAGTLASSSITQNSCTLSVTGASDNASLHTTPYSFSTDNGTTWSAYQASTSYSATGLSSGTAYTCKHRVRDAAGNVTVGTAITVTTLSPDTTPPTVGTLAASSISYTTFTLTVSGASDNVALHATPYSFSVDNGTTWSAYQAGTAYNVTGQSPNTTYTCKHRTRDAAGNVSTGTAITPTTLADTTAPVAGTLAQTSVGETTLTATVSGASDNVALNSAPYSFSLDGGATWGEWVASAVYSPVGLHPNQVYAVQHRVRDTSGNLATGTAISITTTDTTAPAAGVLTVTVGVGDAVGSVAGAADAGGLHALPYSFRVDTGAWSDWQASDTYTWIQLGMGVDYDFQHRVRDAVGNTSTGDAVTKTTLVPPPPPPPPAPVRIPVEEFAGSRTERFEFTLLDRFEHEIRPLDTVTGGSLSWSIRDTVRSGGSLTVADDEGISWLDVRIRIRYIMNESEPIGLGVFIPATPTGTRGMYGMPRTIEIYDKLLITKEDAVDETYEVPVDTLVTSKVKELLLSTGEWNVSIPDSDERLKASLTWEAGTTKLRVINDLLDTINYWSLWCDGNGTYRSSPYVAPTDRPIVWEFTEGENSIYLTTFEDEQDNFSVPNKYICLSRVEGEEQPFVSVVANLDEQDPYSYPRRGRWIVVQEPDVEATSQAVLDHIAARKLASAGTVTRSFSISHAWLPLDLNDTVLFDNPTNQIIGARCSVQKMEMDLSTGFLMKTRLRQLTVNTKVREEEDGS